MKIYEFGALGFKNINLDIETCTASNGAWRSRREDRESVTSGGKPLGIAIELKQGMKLKKMDFWHCRKGFLERP